jgi:hypothetical protein
MGYKDDESSYSGNDDDDDEEEYEDDFHSNRNNSSSDEDFNEKQKSEPAANKKRPRNVVDGPMKDEREDERMRMADTKVKKEHIVPLKPDELFVDWGNILHRSANTKAWWVHQPFINHNLPLIEIDKLIGYSTHITTYHHPCTTATSSASTITAANKGRTFHNPLLGLPNVPIRPTLLKHLILEPATKLTASYIQHQQRYHKNILDNDSNDDEDEDEWEDRPPRPKKQTKKKQRSDQPQFYERFHHSAAMAIGMFMEEMITATLLPLAQQYVQYCRHHHDTDGANNDGRMWTLPPEEAIMKLYNDSNWNQNSTNSHVGGVISSSSLLSTRIPTRSVVSGAIGTSMLNQPSVQDHERIAYHNWCRTTATNSQMQQQWIENDPSFFQLFIQNIPSSQGPVSISSNTVDTTPTSRRPTTIATTAPLPTEKANMTHQLAYEI